jgi:hypothetical protein
LTLTRLKRRAEKLKNAKPNLSILKEYRKREQEFLKRAQDLEKITALRDAEKQKYDGLRKQRLDEFMAGFSLISMKLKEMYQVSCSFLNRSANPELTSYPPIHHPDDHPRWQRRARAGRQHGPLLGGYHLQRYATEKELEEHLESLWW